MIFILTLIICIHKSIFTIWHVHCTLLIKGQLNIQKVTITQGGVYLPRKRASLPVLEIRDPQIQDPDPHIFTGCQIRDRGSAIRAKNSADLQHLYTTIQSWLNLAKMANKVVFGLHLSNFSKCTSKIFFIGIRLNYET